MSKYVVPKKNLVSISLQYRQNDSHSRVIFLHRNFQLYCKEAIDLIQQYTDCTDSTDNVRR